MNKVFNILFTGKLLQTINWKSLDVIDGEIALGRGIESIGVSDWVHDIAVYRKRESLGVRGWVHDIAVYRESLGVRGEVHDIAVYRDKVFLACGDGLRRYTIKY